MNLNIASYVNGLYFFFYFFWSYLYIFLDHFSFAAFTFYWFLKYISEWSEVTQSCLTLCYPMDCSLPASSVHGMFQAIVLEWIAISFSRVSSQTRDWIWVSRIVDRHFTIWATREVIYMYTHVKNFTAVLYSIEWTNHSLVIHFNVDRPLDYS